MSQSKLETGKMIFVIFLFFLTSAILANPVSPPSLTTRSHLDVTLNSTENKSKNDADEWLSFQEEFHCTGQFFWIFFMVIHMVCFLIYPNDTQQETGKAIPKKKSTDKNEDSNPKSQISKKDENKLFTFVTYCLRDKNIINAVCNELFLEFLFIFLDKCIWIALFSFLLGLIFAWIINNSLSGETLTGCNGGVFSLLLLHITISFSNGGALHISTPCIAFISFIFKEYGVNTKSNDNTTTTQSSVGNNQTDNNSNPEHNTQENDSSVRNDQTDNENTNAQESEALTGNRPTVKNTNPVESTNKKQIIRPLAAVLLGGVFSLLFILLIIFPNDSFSHWYYIVFSLTLIVIIFITKIFDCKIVCLSKFLCKILYY